MNLKVVEFLFLRCIFKLACFLCFSFFYLFGTSYGISVAVQAKDISQVRFKERMWDSRVLRILIEGPKYISANKEFDILSPPLNNSKEVLGELKILNNYQGRKYRTSLQISEIKREASKRAFVDMFIDAPVVSKKLSRIAYHLLSMADKECQYFVVKYKKRFARARPSQLVPNLKLVVPNPGHASYPSGHATQSMLLAQILKIIDPTNSEAYLNYARSMARRREIAGVHYPSDSLAGQTLAEQILLELIEVEEFERELNYVTVKFNQNKNKQ